MSELQWLFSILGLAVLAMLAMGAWDNRRTIARALAPVQRRARR